MNKEMAAAVLGHIARTGNEHHNQQVMDYLENNMLDPADAFARRRAFLKANRRKIRKWPKYVGRGNKLPADLCLYDRIICGRENKFVQVPAYVNVYCCNGTEEYYDDVARCHPWKENLDEYYILRNIGDARWLIARKERNMCVPALHGQVNFVKVGLNRFKMTFNPMRDSPRDPNLDGILEIYDNGRLSIWKRSSWYGIGNSGMDTPVEATYRYRARRCLSTEIFISLFVKILPHIQEYLDRVEKLYDRKYAKEDSSILQRIRDYFTYDADAVGKTLDANGYVIA